MANGGEPGVESTNVVPAWLKRLWKAHPLVVVAAVAVVALALIVAFIWPFTDWIAVHDVGLIAGSKRAAALQTAREAARTQLLTLGAGVFAAGALLFTARNFILSRRTVDLTRRTFELAEQGQVTDRYTKAIEQLGSDKLDMRIGGIYALEQVARDSERDHPTVVDVLSSFVRRHSQQALTASDGLGRSFPERRIRPDIQAAITVIGRRGAERDTHILDLNHADLTDAILDYANLTALSLKDGDIPYLGRIKLTDIRDDRRLIGVYLDHAKFTGATLKGADLTLASLTSANLVGAHLAEAKFIGADLSDAILTPANPPGAAPIPVKLTGADLTRANLTGADLTGADLTGADLTGATLKGADLTRVRWPEGVRDPEGWIVDSNSGLLKDVNELSEVVAHYGL